MKRIVFLLVSLISVTTMDVIGKTPTKTDLENTISQLKEDTTRLGKENRELLKSNIQLTDQLQEKEWMEEVYRYFSNESEDIFTKRLSNEAKTHLSDADLRKYSVILKISDLNSKLDAIELKITEGRAKPNLTYREQKSWIKGEIGEEMRTISTLVDEIEKQDMKFLSSEQRKKYHRLFDRFNEIYMDYVS